MKQNTFCKVVAILLYAATTCHYYGQDRDADNDGILNRTENSHCGVPVYTAPGQMTPGFTIQPLYYEDFGQMSLTYGQSSISLNEVSGSLSTTYSYYKALYGKTPTQNQGGSGFPSSLQDGSYTVFNSILYTASYASDRWQNIGDHTGGRVQVGNGRMLIVNSNHVPGEIFRKTLLEVKEGAPLNVSLWLMNMDVSKVENNGRLLPNVTVKFVQGGSTVYSFSTGDIKRESKGVFSAWKVYQNPTVFIPTSNAPIDLVLINNSPGGEGNDLALDDILVYQSFCDTDNDGIPDYLDLDSDNDGCYDAIEGDRSIGPQQLNGDGSIVGSEDENGIPVLAHGGQGKGLTYDGISSCVEVCTKTILGVDVDLTDGTPKTYTIGFAGHEYYLDLYRLDKSFDLTINGLPITQYAMQFQSHSSSLVNVRFADGSEYGTNGQDGITQMVGNEQAPLLRVVISATGEISLFGSKISGGPLYPLELYHGNTYNTIAWYPNGFANTIVLNQPSYGSTFLKGYFYGMDKVLCYCYKQPNKSGVGLDTKHGISSLGRAGFSEFSHWPMIRKGAWMALESKTKGFVINRISKTADVHSIPEPVEGMMVYDEEADCLKIYSTKDGLNYAWLCFVTPACPN